jgi:hypothetical protein
MLAAILSGSFLSVSSASPAVISTAWKRLWVGAQLGPGPFRVLCVLRGGSGGAGCGPDDAQRPGLSGRPAAERPDPSGVADQLHRGLSGAKFLTPFVRDSRLGSRHAET